MEKREAAAKAADAELAANAAVWAKHHANMTKVEVERNVWQKQQPLTLQQLQKREQFPEYCVQLWSHRPDTFGNERGLSEVMAIQFYTVSLGERNMYKLARAIS